MRASATKNFHLPLPGATRILLQETADREGVPATVLARQALEDWLRARERETRAREIAAYAAAEAGGAADLDPALEATSIQSWLAGDREAERRGKR